ncbi:flippase [Haloarchaeobius sp. FL176]|uniref:flippase n=1 Tax=Haloarchaeobius sp. FL176 TaxID=2967129 RepID=UPI00214922C9|nr:flippase [Haloarchaeobius sp. FL176]
MNLGQTSVVYLVSRIVATAFGFLSTIYLARILGADVLGDYYLVVGLVAWLSIVGNIGFSKAISKRISEGVEQGEFVAAGVFIIGTMFTLITFTLVVARPYVNDYIGLEATVYVVFVLFATLANSTMSSILTGLGLVHIDGVLGTVKTAGRSLFQIGAVLLGLKLAGLFIGYLAGYLVAIAIALYFVMRGLDRFSLPSRRHFESLTDFAKFSWIGSLRSKMFSFTDILVLGFFVPSSLIGIYSIAWNISEFLIIFSTAISTTLFPKMSELSAKEGNDAVRNLVEDSLAYAGLFLIPGIVGGAILGRRILRIYGQEFTQGAIILIILIVANFIMSYQNQILNTLDAINRPDLSFRVNGAFAVANVALNVALIPEFSWVGAAVATTLSVAISLILGYYYLNTVMTFSIPYAEFTRQWAAALIMGAVVYQGLRMERSSDLISQNFIVVLVLVGLGASVYFAVYFLLSARFQRTVSDNLPFDVPMLPKL